MSVSSFKKFCKAVNGDKELGKEIQRLRSRYPMERISVEDAYKFIVNDVIPFAKEHGYEFTFKDTCITGRKEGNSGALSDEDLAAVTGGFSVINLALGMSLLATSAGVGAGVVANLSGNLASTPSVSQSASVSAPGQQSQSAEVKQEAEKVDEAAAEEEGLNEESEDSEEGANHTIDLLSEADESEEEDAGESKSEFSWKDLGGTWSAKQEETKSEEDEFQEIEVQEEQVTETNSENTSEESEINDVFETPSSSSAPVIKGQKQNANDSLTSSPNPDAQAKTEKEVDSDGKKLNQNSDSDSNAGAAQGGKKVQNSDSDSIQEKVKEKSGGTPSSQNATPEVQNENAKTPQVVEQDDALNNPTDTHTQENDGSSVASKATTPLANQVQNEISQNSTDTLTQKEIDDHSTPSILNQSDANKPLGQNKDGAQVTNSEGGPEQDDKVIQKQGNAPQNATTSDSQSNLNLGSPTQEKDDKKKASAEAGQGDGGTPLSQNATSEAQDENAGNVQVINQVQDSEQDEKNEEKKVQSFDSSSEATSVILNQVNADKPPDQNDDGTVATDSDVDQQNDAKGREEFSSAKKYLEYLKTTEDKLSTEQECIKLLYEGKSTDQVFEYLQEKGIGDTDVSAVFNAVKNKYDEYDSSSDDDDAGVANDADATPEEQDKDAKKDNVKTSSQVDQVSDGVPQDTTGTSAPVTNLQTGQGGDTTNNSTNANSKATNGQVNDDTSNNSTDTHAQKNADNPVTPSATNPPVNPVQSNATDNPTNADSKATKGQDNDDKNAVDTDLNSQTNLDLSPDANQHNDDVDAGTTAGSKATNGQSNDDKNAVGTDLNSQTNLDLSPDANQQNDADEGQDENSQTNNGQNDAAADLNKVQNNVADAGPTSQTKKKKKHHNHVADFEYSEKYLNFIKEQSKLGKEDTCIKMFAGNKNLEAVLEYLKGQGLDSDSATKMANETKDKYEKLKSTKINPLVDFAPKKENYDEFCEKLQGYKDEDIIERGKLTVNEASNKASDGGIVLGPMQLLFMKYGYQECAKNEDGKWTGDGRKSVKKKLIDHYCKENNVDPGKDAEGELRKFVRKLAVLEGDSEEALKNDIPVNNAQNEMLKNLKENFTK
jgi:hypothetical protein